MESATCELYHNMPQQLAECALTGSPTSSYDVFPISYRICQSTWNMLCRY